VSAGSLPKCIVDSFLVGVSHYTEFRDKLPVTGTVYIRNATKSPTVPYSAMLREVGSNPESVFGIRSPPKVSRFLLLVGLIITLSFNEIG